MNRFKMIIMVVVVMLLILSPLAIAENVTLNVVSNGHNNVHIFVEHVLPIFEKETGIKVKVDFAGDAKMKALLDVRTRKGFYDVICFDSSFLPEFVRGKILYPIDEFIEHDKEEVRWDNLLLTGKGLVTEEDKVYGVPNIIQIWMMMIRKDRFDETGLPIPPKTWNELYEYAKKLTKPEKKQYGFVTQPGKAYNSITHSFWAFMVGFGGTRVTFKDIPYDHTPILDAPIPIETLKFLGKLLEVGPPGMKTYVWADAIASYSKGDSAMYPIYSDAWSIFEDPEQSDVVGKNTMTPQPSYPGRPESKKLPYGGWGYGISPLSKNKEAAWKLLKWMISPEILNVWIKNGGVPMRISNLRDPEVQNKYPWAKYVLERELAGQVDTEYRPRIPAWAMIEQIFGTELSLFFTGDKSAEQVFSDGNKKLKKYMIQEGYPVLGG